MASGSNSWKMSGTLAAIAATIVVRKVLDVSWKTATGRTPPRNPESPDVDWPEAVAWALASGAAVGLARLLATRKVADYWRKSTGHLPAGLQEVDV